LPRWKKNDYVITSNLTKNCSEPTLLNYSSTTFVSISFIV